VLKINDLCFAHNGFELLKNISVVLNQGSIVSVVDKRNTSDFIFFRVISGLEIATSGKIFFLEKEILKNNNRLDFICLESYKDVFEQMTIEENIKLGAWKIKNKKNLKANLELVYKLIPDLIKLKNILLKNLGNGERMLTALAAAVISLPKLIIIYKPTQGFYPLFAEKILNVIREANKLGISFLLLEKNLVYASKISDWIYEMQDGEIIKEGDVESFRKFDLRQKKF